MFIFGIPNIMFHHVSFIELDYGKIGTGKPQQFDGKKPMGFRFRFSQENPSGES